MRPWRAAGIVGGAALAVLCILPIAVLVPAALSEPGVAASALTARRLALLLTSGRLATIVLLADTLLAGGVALWAHAAPRRHAVALLAIALAAAFVPPVAHAAAWSAVGEGLRRALSLQVVPLTGLPAAALAQATAFLPLAIVVALAGVFAVDPAIIDAARVSRSDTSALARILLPLAVPAMLAGGGVAAILSLGDEAVPAVFGVDTGAMELFASYAADGRPGATLALAWPLALVSAAAAIACVAPLRRASLHPAWGRRGWSTPPSLAPGARIALASSGAAAAGGSLVVFAALVVGAWPPATAARAVTAALPDIATTLAVAAACGLVAGAIALLAGLPAGPGATPPRWMWAVALLAAVVPAPVVGAGLVALVNHPWSGALYDSPAMLVLASLARFAPIAAVLVAVAASRLHRATVETALIQRAPRVAFARVVLPLLAPAAVAGGLLVAAFAAGELGATLMVVPAGTSTAVVRAFNLLHYGASQEVAAIALAVAVAGIATAGGAYLVGRKAWSR